MLVITCGRTITIYGLTVVNPHSSKASNVLIYKEDTTTNERFHPWGSSVDRNDEDKLLG